LKKYKVCHLTSVAHLSSAHQRNDTRIFLKMCISLAKNNYKVHLVVADGLGNAKKKGVFIHDVGSTKNRLDRILNASKRVFKKALKLNVDIYHLHDPELIPIGKKLKRLGKKVIFDSHEDVPKQMLSNTYMSKPTRQLFSYSLKYYEAWACRKFDAIIAATPYIRDKFLKINPSTLDVNNYPIVGNNLGEKTKWSHKQIAVCYVGAIGSIRGIKEVISAMSILRTDAYLKLCGKFFEPSVESKIKGEPGWEKVEYFGYLNMKKVMQVLNQSIAGLVTFHPLPNHINAQPNKMFEYMSAGIPVIASDFPLWSEIIVGNDCGLCVDPLNPQAIAEAIDFLCENPMEAERMGKNGLRVVKEKYNWSTEEKKLINLYNKVLDN